MNWAGSIARLLTALNSVQIRLCTGLALLPLELLLLITSQGKSSSSSLCDLARSCNIVQQAVELRASWWHRMELQMPEVASSLLLELEMEAESIPKQPD